MAWTTNPYATLSQVANALDLSASALARDTPFLQELIDEAQSAIDKELGYSFQTDGTLASPATRTYDGRGLASLSIDRCVSFSQVTETIPVINVAAGVFVVSSPVTADITADCILYPLNSTPGYKLKRKSGIEFREGTGNYTVTGIFGRPIIPADITRACVRIVVHYYKQRDTNYADMVAEQGAVRQKYTKQLPPDVVEILERYKPRLFLSWGS